MVWFKFLLSTQMNRVFDYNGVQIAPSKPVQKLRTLKRTLYIDSGDRDIIKYPTNGDFVVYLPRVYERVVSLNIRAAEFPNPVNAFFHSYSSTGTAGNPYASDATLFASPLYFFLEVSGLNRSDETSPSADRSAYTDSVFAKFQNTSYFSSTGQQVLPPPPILYNESSGERNIEYYQPPISKLDRLQLKTRLHDNSTPGFIYWSGGNANDTGIGYEYSLTIEIETIENSFDDFSSTETQIGERSSSGFHGI